jgi:hypothetical protein
MRSRSSLIRIRLSQLDPKFEVAQGDYGELASARVKGRTADPQGGVGKVDKQAIPFLDCRGERAVVTG